MQFTGKVRGARALQATLEEMSRRPKVATINKASREALQPMKQEIERQARPRRQRGKKRPKGGHLDEGIRIQHVKKGGGRRKRTTKLGPGTPRAVRIAHLVELGTAPHWQPNRNGGQWHPGARPYPFMRPAFEATQDEVLQEFEEAIWRGITREVTQIPGVRRRR